MGLMGWGSERRRRRKDEFLYKFGTSRIFPYGETRHSKSNTGRDLSPDRRTTYIALSAVVFQEKEAAQKRPER